MVLGLKYKKGIKLIQEGEYRLFVQKTLNTVRRIVCRLDLSLKSLWVREFHRAYYYSEVWRETYWFGTPILQCPLDMWIIQEIICENKPDFLIESGTFNGGSAYFYAHIFDLIDHGEVITIDIKDRQIPSHPRITKIVGSSTSSKTINKVKSMIGDGKTMVVLDSAHNTEHVLKEMQMYSQLVNKDHYLVVTDSNVNGNPISFGYREGDRGGGPMEAIQKFFKNNNEFIIDRKREKFLLTFFPSGFLRRVRARRN